MSFLARAAVAAFFLFAMVSAARAQAPVQASTQATAPPPDNEFYSLREPAAAGDAQAQFALANHHFYGVGLPQDYRQALLFFRFIGVSVKPPLARSLLSPPLLTCLHQFVQVRSRPYLDRSKPILEAWQL